MAVTKKGKVTRFYRVSKFLIEWILILIFEFVTAWTFCKLVVAVLEAGRI